MRMAQYISPKRLEATYKNASSFEDLSDFAEAVRLYCDLLDEEATPLAMQREDDFSSGLRLPPVAPEARWKFVERYAVWGSNIHVVEITIHSIAASSNCSRLDRALSNIQLETHYGEPRGC